MAKSTEELRTLREEIENECKEQFDRFHHEDSSFHAKRIRRLYPGIMHHIARAGEQYEKLIVEAATERSRCFERLAQDIEEKAALGLERELAYCKRQLESFKIDSQDPLGI
jgi:hypothetical protein